MHQLGSGLPCRVKATWTPLSRQRPPMRLRWDESSCPAAARECGSACPRGLLRRVRRQVDGGPPPDAVLIDLVSAHVTSTRSLGVESITLVYDLLGPDSLRLNRIGNCSKQQG